MVQLLTYAVFGWLIGGFLVWGAFFAYAFFGAQGRD